VWIGGWMPTEEGKWFVDELEGEIDKKKSG